MKYAVYANCQGPQLAEFLNCVPAFAARYSHVALSACHAIEESEIDFFVSNQIKDIDVFIYMPVHDGYRGSVKFSSGYFLSRLRPNCIRIAFPSLYFRVYDWLIGYTHKETGEKLVQPHAYHDLILLKTFAWNRHEPTKEIARRYRENVSDPANFDHTAIVEAVATNILDLRRREQDIEDSGNADLCVRVADFIEQNYQRERLFKTFNHPTKHMYWHLVRRILDHLQIKYATGDAEPEIDAHVEFTAGIPSALKAHLKLQFSDTTPLPSAEYSVKQYVRRYRGLAAADLRRMFIDIGSHPIEGNGKFEHGWSFNEGTHRWADSDRAVITVQHWKRLPSRFDLFFKLHGARAQTVRVFLNEVEVGAITLDGQHTQQHFIKIDAVLRPIDNVIEIKTNIMPSRIDGPDQRALTFAISELSFVERGTAWSLSLPFDLAIRIAKKLFRAVYRNPSRVGR